MGIDAPDRICLPREQEQLHSDGFRQCDDAVFRHINFCCFHVAEPVHSQPLQIWTDTEFKFELENSMTGHPQIQFMLSWLLLSFGHFMQDKSRLALSRKNCRFWLGELFSQSSTMLQSILYLRVNGKQQEVRLFNNAMICFNAVRILISSTMIMFGNCGPQLRIRDLLFRTP